MLTSVHPMRAAARLAVDPRVRLAAQGRTSTIARTDRHAIMQRPAGTLPKHSCRPLLDPVRTDAQARKPHRRGPESTHAPVLAHPSDGARRPLRRASHRRACNAITNGTFDGEGHPTVGGLVSPTQYSVGTWIYCSGTLISTTVFLTAAHCSSDGERVAVTFDSDHEAGERVYYCTFRADPLYPATRATPMTSRWWSSIADNQHRSSAAARGRLALGRARPQLFTSVGYGAYEVTNEPGGTGTCTTIAGWSPPGSLNSINKTWLRISLNASTGNGGTC
jgi:hypothetical protein